MTFSGVRSAFRNASYLAASNLIGVGVRIIYVVFLAKYLGSELYGLFAYAQSFYLIFLPLTVFGLSGILIRELGRRTLPLSDVAGRYLGGRILLAAVTVIVYGAISIWADEDSPLSVVQMIFCIALIGRSFSLWNESLFTGLERSQETLKLQAVWRTAEAITGIVLLIMGVGVVSIAWVHGISWVLQALIGARRTLQAVPALVPSFSVDGLFGLLSQGWPLAIAGFLVSWSQQVPIVMYKYFGETADLGQVAIAYQVFAVFLVIPVALGQASLPVLTRSIDRKDRKDDLYVSVTIRSALLVTALLGVGVVALAEPVFMLMFGREYLLAADLARYFVWLLAPVAVAGITRGMSLSYGHTSQVLLNSALSAVVLSLTAPVLISLIGPKGIALSSALAFTCSSVIFAFPYVRKLDKEHRKALFASLGVFLLAGLLAFYSKEYAPEFILCGFLILVPAIPVFGAVTKTELEYMRNYFLDSGTGSK